MSSSFTLIPVPTLTSLLTEDIDAVLQSAKRNSLTRDNPALADLPVRFESLRDHQRVAVREILCAYEEGAECVVLDAPTGSGKSVVGEVVRRLLPDNRQTTYICSSKSLQDQVLREFDYAKVLKGRSNYATERYPERFGPKDGLSSADCTKTPGDSESCLWCSSTHLCPYEQAKSAALRSELAVLNTSYFLSECNGPGRFSRGGLVIADEADVLEKELLSHVSLQISKRRLDSYKLGVPKKVTVPAAWLDWAEQAHEVVKASRPKPTNDPIKDIRASNRHTALVEKLLELKRGLAEERYIYTGTQTEVEFKPITVDTFGPEKLWQHGDKWLLMSATVISADEMLDSLGFEGNYRLVKVQSTFKPENRKVIVAPVANMVYKEQEQEWPKLADGVIEILKRHPDERVLIHSVSYKLTDYLRSKIVDSQRVGEVSPEVSESGIGVLAVDRNDAMERVRATQGGSPDKWSVDSSERKRSPGVLSGIQGGDNSRDGDRSSLPGEALCEPGSPGDGYSHREQAKSDARSNGMQVGPSIPAEQSVHSRRKEALQNLSSRRRQIISYASGSEKEGAVKRYLETPNAVLVAPSLDRGVDLPDEACRVQVIVKVPYLNLKDKQIAARRFAKNGSMWYSIQAIRTIVQMSGRGVRHENDHCVTYLVDRQFITNLWGTSKRLFPSWWKEGLEWRMKGL